VTLVKRGSAESGAVTINNPGGKEGGVNVPKQKRSKKVSTSAGRRIETLEGGLSAQNQNWVGGGGRKY